MLTQAAGVPVNEAELPENEPELIVDALLGYGQSRHVERERRTTGTPLDESFVVLPRVVPRHRVRRTPAQLRSRTIGPWANGEVIASPSCA